MTASNAARELIHDGRVIATFVPFVQEQPTVDDVEVLVPIADAVPILLREFAGHWLTSRNDALTQALLEAGASLVRHGHRFRHDLEPIASTPGMPEGLSAGPITASSSTLGALSVIAYPNGHVDHETAVVADAARDLARLLWGELVGPFVEAASVQVNNGNDPVGVCIINRMPNGVGGSDPWVSEVFRRPDAAYRGLGTVMLVRSIKALSQSGESSLGLVVTEGNPAESIYRDLGFDLVRSTRKLQIPPYV